MTKVHHRLSAMVKFAALAGVAALTGCALPYPDVRSATYGALGPSVVVMRPATVVPDPATRKYLANEFPFVPGSVTRPFNISARNDDRGRAAEWGITSARRCYPSAKVHRLSDTGPIGGTPDIVIDYVLDVSLWGILEFVTRGAPASDQARARRDLGLSRNEVRFVRRIKIAISNIKTYEASAQQLARARADIFRDPDCRRLITGKGTYQIARMYEAQVYEVSIEVMDGAAVDVATLKGRILSAFTRRVRGANVFFALKADSLTTRP
jgi:hypothetical protein